MSEAMKYPSNPLTAMDQGCMLDLRVKLAVDILKSPMFTTAITESPAQIASTALDIATELLSLGEERGLVAPLPDHSELTAVLKRHIERSVRAQLFQQQCGQRFSREDGAITVVPSGGMQ